MSNNTEKNALLEKESQFSGHAPTLYCIWIVVIGFFTQFYKQNLKFLEIFENKSGILWRKKNGSDKVFVLEVTFKSNSIS